MPKCPKCGSEMILRKAKKGKNVGNSFYGCSNFPKCWGTLHDKDTAGYISPKEIEDSLTKEMKVIIKKEYEKIQLLINEIWKVEKNERFDLRIKIERLAREIKEGQKGNIIYGQSSSKRASAARILQNKKEKEIAENNLKELREKQLKKLKEIEDIIKI